MKTAEIKEAVRQFDEIDRVPLDYRHGVTFQDVGGTLTICTGPKDAPDHQLRVTPELWEAVVNHLGMGKRYAESTPVELLYPHLNWHFGEEAERPEIFALARTEHEKEYGIGLLRPDKFTINAKAAVDAITTGLDVPDKDLEWRMLDNGLSHITLMASTKNRAYEVQSRHVDDILHGGVRATFSPIGACDVQVSPYVERLICTNGMTSIENLVSWRAPAGEGANDPYEWLAGSTARAYEMVDAQFEACQEMANTPVDEAGLPQYVASMFDHYRLPGVLQDAVVRQLADGNVMDVWDLMNVITYAATHDERIRDPRQRVRLMGVGGDLAAHHNRCPSCSSLLIERGATA
jgi:hypothetical protein